MMLLLVAHLATSSPAVTAIVWVARANECMLLRAGSRIPLGPRDRDLPLRIRDAVWCRKGDGTHQELRLRDGPAGVTMRDDGTSYVVRGDGLRPINNLDLGGLEALFGRPHEAKAAKAAGSR
jgi:hypothetical protein